MGCSEFIELEVESFAESFFDQRLADGSESNVLRVSLASKKIIKK